MLRRVLPIAILFSTPLAHADDTLESGPRDLGLARRYALTHGGLTWQGFAQLSGGATTDTSEGGVAAGAELRVVAPECDAVRLGGQGRITSLEGGHASAENWASVCFHLAPMTLELGHHLEWDVRPALLAPLGLRRGDNRRETASFRWQPLLAPLAWIAPPADGRSMPTGALVVFEVNVQLTFLWSAHGGLATHGTTEAMPFRYVRAHTTPWDERRDFAVDVGRASAEFTDDGAAIRVWLARLENLELGPLLVTGGAGIASASAGEFSPTAMQREISITTPRLELGLETGGRRVHGYLRGTRDTAITPDGYALLDTRLASGLKLELPELRIGLDATAARTRVYVPGTHAARGVTGGGALTLAHRLVPHVDATLQLAVARSFYAAPIAPMTSAVADARWGVQALAALQATVGN